MANPNTLLLLLLFLLSSTASASYNVINFGAKPDGRTDSAKPFLSAWAAACRTYKSATIYVPAGNFLVSQASFLGPCNNTAIRIYISGTILAPSGYSSETLWLMFQYVEGMSIFGGTLDGRGQAFWACKTRGRNCPSGTTSLTIAMSKNVLIQGLTLMNSEVFQMSIFGSTGVTVQRSKIQAPGDSPNTDGIHVQMSSGVTITDSAIRTGDDCVSMGPGSSNVWIERVSCGPGHGISIGSLGGAAGEPGVQNITVKSVVFTGTQNGLRVKTWGIPNTGFVKGLTFRLVVMKNVQNPIFFDQNYCPSKVNCPGQSSGVKISNAVFSNVQGTSATPVAVSFDCSQTNPCSGIRLQNIKLMYQNKPAQAFCKNAKGTTSGFVIPPSCLR